MVKALLCDIDGTLVQSNWLHADAWRIAFEGMGLQLDTEALRRQIGKGGDELIPVFVPWWKREIIADSLKVYRAFIFNQDFMHQVEPLPGARDLIARVHAAGIHVALSSSAKKPELEKYKQLIGIEEFVDTSTSADDASKAKPHPDIFSATLAKLKLPAGECIALGDTPYDAESAGLAGLRTIGVTTGGWSHRELLDAGCVEVYDSVAELLDKFEQSALCRTDLH